MITLIKKCDICVKPLNPLQLTKEKLHILYFDTKYNFHFSHLFQNFGQGSCHSPEWVSHAPKRSSVPLPWAELHYNWPADNHNTLFGNSSVASVNSSAANLPVTPPGSPWSPWHQSTKAEMRTPWTTHKSPLHLLIILQHHKDDRGPHRVFTFIVGIQFWHIYFSGT